MGKEATRCPSGELFVIQATLRGENRWQVRCGSGGPSRTRTCRNPAELKALNIEVLGLAKTACSRYCKDKCDLKRLLKVRKHRPVQCKIRTR